MKLTEILVVHHTHTDWGYTTHPEQAAALHRRYLEDAVRLCRQHAGRPEPTRFRWTCESALVVEEFLNEAAPALRRQFIELAQAGLIEVTATPVCPTPHNHARTISAALETARDLRRHIGIDVTVAMFSDINGLNWPWVDALLDAGVTRLAMAMNFVCGGGMERYTHFHWQGPNNRRIRAWQGQHYNYGVFWGLNCAAFDMETVVRQRLAELANYPREKLLLQVTNIPADNMGPHPEYLRFIDRYNALAEEHDWPRMRTATLADWFGWLEATEPTPPVHRGDWTDWWATVLTQTPTATAAVREATRRVLLAERWLARRAASLRDSYADRVRACHRHLYLANEHTVGSSKSVPAPDSFAALAGAAARKNLCYQTLYRATDLLRDVLSDSERGEPLLLFDDELESFDPSWAAVVEEDAAGSVPGRDLLPPTDAADAAVVHELAVDVCDRDGAVSIRPAASPGTELCGECEDGRFGQIVYERPGDDDRNQWFDVSGGQGVEMQNGLITWPTNAVWSRHTLTGAPEVDDQGGTGAVSLIGPDGLTATLRLTSGEGRRWVDLTYLLDVPFSVSPRSFYILFPFDFRPEQVWADVGGVWMDPRRDNVPGSCRNWLTVHQGVLMTTGELSLLWRPVDAPLVMFDGICPNPPKAQARLDRACLVSWVAHSYWFTCCPSRFGGTLRFRYRIFLLPGNADCQQAQEVLDSTLWPTSMQTRRVRDTTREG